MESSMSDCVEKKECRCCGGTNLYKFIDLGTQPLANTYPEIPQVLPEYPLAVNVCKDCWHTQLTHLVSPDLLFKNYLYVSGTSNTLRDFFKANAYWLTKSLVRYEKRSPESIYVLDIACNDGSQLDAFKELGCQTYGVDPAENLVPEAVAKGHHVICSYWDESAAKQLKKMLGRYKFDVITAQNVFAHTDGILAFLEACKIVMKNTTKLVIQTSQRNMYKNGEFDTIYHEHLSFFSTNSMKTVVERAGLYLNHVYHNPMHGGSYEFHIGKLHSGYNDEGTPYSNTDREIINEHHLYHLSTYEQFGKRAEETVKHLKRRVEYYQSKDYEVIGYGAAAKGMTVLNFGQIKLDCIVDDNPLKQFRFTPGNEHVQTRILPTSTLQPREKPLVIIPLAWNFWSEIAEKVTSMRNNPDDIFIRYFPDFKVIKNGDTKQNTINGNL